MYMKGEVYSVKWCKYRKIPENNILISYSPALPPLKIFKKLEEENK